LGDRRGLNPLFDRVGKMDLRPSLSHFHILFRILAAMEHASSNEKVIVCTKRSAMILGLSAWPDATGF
jgi:hypothetical protein